MKRLPLLANHEERPCVASYLKEIPRDHNLGEGAESAIQRNQEINLGELPQALKEILAVQLLGDVAVGGEAVPRRDGVADHFAAHVACPLGDRLHDAGVPARCHDESFASERASYGDSVLIVLVGLRESSGSVNPDDWDASPRAGVHSQRVPTGGSVPSIRKAIAASSMHSLFPPTAVCPSPT